MRRNFPVAMASSSFIVHAGRERSAFITGGFSEPDPDLGLRPHEGGPLAPARLTLVTSLASGGTASWLILERP